ncbi:hypothetical protein HF086_002327 [Spodoptera exigua]|uniref:Uncharacterized protein n=1 Tax=Spodoptera exigua TaxID=7107 RepID=A0A922MT55_SPOEX|nr:hypothetical protein HF086_002327 [Spodoptera exigua]
MELSADMYQNQKELSENIQKVCINIKKDGWARKNADYFKRRIQMLETLWSEFQFNHDSLTTEESVTHPYFTSDLYNKTRQIYKEVKDLIILQHQQLSMQLRSQAGRSVTPTASTSQQGQEDVSDEQGKQSTEEEGDMNNASENQDDNNRERSPSHQQHSLTKREIGSNSKLDELLRMQTANFKAFIRADANIQVDFISGKWEFDDALQTLQARWSAVDKLHWEIDCELNGDRIVVYEERYTSRLATGWLRNHFIHYQSRVHFAIMNMEFIAVQSF